MQSQQQHAEQWFQKSTFMHSVELQINMICKVTARAAVNEFIVLTTSKSLLSGKVAVCHTIYPETDQTNSLLGVCVVLFFVPF